MASKLEEFKKEWSEYFTEQREGKLKTRVFTLMGSIEEVKSQIEALEVEKTLLNERKEKLEAELAALE